MKMTLSVIKADIGSIGGHIAPSRRRLETVAGHIRQHGAPLVVDSYLSHTGGDIAILMTHRQGVGDAGIHKLAWDAFLAGTAAAKQQGLYGLEYTGIVEELRSLDKRFVVRPEKPGRA